MLLLTVLVIGSLTKSRLRFERCIIFSSSVPQAICNQASRPQLSLCNPLALPLFASLFTLALSLSPSLAPPHAPRPIACIPSRRTNHCQIGAFLPTLDLEGLASDYSSLGVRSLCFILYDFLLFACSF
jgi:hypothetical protein